MDSLILDIQRCSIHDGPGIRTTVFLKGCPLRCSWCHNPESQSFKEQLRYTKEKCTHCGICEKVCPQEVHHVIGGVHEIAFDECTLCRKCIQSCPEEALDTVGKRFSVEEVMNTIREDMPFYKKSKGGITLSGGEPLSHPDFVLELLKECKKEGIHTCVETSGFGRKDVLETIIDWVDLFLIDYKITGESLHKEHTGVSDQVIRDNLKILDEHGKQIILRCPIIPGINDTNKHFDAMVEMEKTYENIKSVELLPYHKLGVGKSMQVGMTQNFYEEPTCSQVEDWLHYCKSKGSMTIKKG